MIHKVQFENTGYYLLQSVENNVDTETVKWLNDKVDTIIATNSTKDLYLTYSLIATKIGKSKVDLESLEYRQLREFLEAQEINSQQLTRIYLVHAVLEKDPSFFEAKVAGIIQVADTGELETFLKFLVLLPNAGNFKHVAVDALRTNIATIFDAIALNNPYPGLFFESKEWNQLFLKAAFMERDLNTIWDIDQMANTELARIISDYAHERWAASREVAPHFWRPVTNFLDDILIQDMERLLKSDRKEDRSAGALCCYGSKMLRAMALLDDHPELTKQIENETITWNTLK